MIPKFLRLRPEARRSDIIRVHNDTVMKLETVIIGLEKKIKSLEDGTAGLSAVSVTEEEV